VATSRSDSDVFVTEEIELTVTDVADDLVRSSSFFSDGREDGGDGVDPSEVVFDGVSVFGDGPEDGGGGGGPGGAVFNGASVNPAMSADEDEIRRGRVPTIPESIELEVVRRTVVEELDSRLKGAKASLLLGYESNVYSYVGRTQFLDLAKQELSDISSETLDSKDAFNQQLTLSQFVVGAGVQNTPALRDISNVILGEFTQPILGAGAMLGIVVATAAATVTSTQLPRVLDVEQLLDDEESIEEIVSN